jgi:hypothetical protein
MFTVQQLIEKARAQSEGMKELGSHLAAGAPFTAAQIAREADALEAKRAAQQAAKTALHAATANVTQLAQVLRDAYARNVAFYVGKLGKRDARLPKVGGRVPKKRRSKNNAATSSPTTPDVKTP